MRALKYMLDMGHADKAAVCAQPHADVWPQLLLCALEYGIPLVYHDFAQVFMGQYALWKSTSEGVHVSNAIALVALSPRCAAPYFASIILALHTDARPRPPVAVLPTPLADGATASRLVELLSTPLARMAVSEIVEIGACVRTLDADGMLAWLRTRTRDPNVALESTLLHVLLMPGLLGRRRPYGRHRAALLCLVLMHAPREATFAPPVPPMRTLTHMQRVECDAVADVSSGLPKEARLAARCEALCGTARELACYAENLLRLAQQRVFPQRLGALVVGPTGEEVPPRADIDVSRFHVEPHQNPTLRKEGGRAVRGGWDVNDLYLLVARLAAARMIDEPVNRDALVHVAPTGVEVEHTNVWETPGARRIVELLDTPDFVALAAVSLLLRYVLQYASLSLLDAIVVTPEAGVHGGVLFLDDGEDSIVTCHNYGHRPFGGSTALLFTPYVRERVADMLQGWMTAFNGNPAQHIAAVLVTSSARVLENATAETRRVLLAARERINVLLDKWYRSPEHVVLLLQNEYV